MGIFGALIKTYKGFRKSNELNKSILKLEEVNNKKLLQLTNNVTFSKYYLAKIELFELQQQHALRSELNNQEIKIIELMKEQIIENREKLKSKNATQLDIANLILSIHKLQHETADNFQSLANEAIKSIESNENTKKELDQNFIQLSSKNLSQNNQFRDSLLREQKELKDSTNEELDSIKIKLKELIKLEEINSRKINDTTAELKGLKSTTESMIHDLSIKLQNQLQDFEIQLENKISLIKNDNRQLQNNLSSLSTKVNDYQKELYQLVGGYREEMETNIKKLKSQTEDNFNILRNENKKTKKTLLLVMSIFGLFALFIAIFYQYFGKL